MIRTQISFDEELYERAQAEAKQRRVSVAELCRRGLRAQLATGRCSARWMQLAGICSSGDPRASETVDDVVYGREEP
jgi:hypothetical protein